MIQESSDVPVAVPMQRDIRLISRQTVSPEAQDSQPQIVMSPDSRERDDPPPPYESVALGYQTVQADFSRSYTSVAIPAGDGIVEFQTVSSEAQEDQPQIVQLPDSSSAVENPSPPYESVALGYQTVQDLSRSYTSVAIPAGDGIVEFQTVSSEAQGDQPQIVQLSGSLAIENTPPPYEDVASGYQTSQVDILPPYDEAVNENITFNANCVREEFTS